MSALRQAIRRYFSVTALAIFFAGEATSSTVLQAMQPPPSGNPIADAAQVSLDAPTEIRIALQRLPVAIVLGAALALRPRRRNQGARKVVVMQTQIMLAVVGAVIMLVVGNSISRAFGIVGAAGLVRYRSTTHSKDDGCRCTRLAVDFLSISLQ